MAEKKVNSTKSLSESELKIEIVRQTAESKKEKKVKVSIPAVLQKQLGAQLFVGVNFGTQYRVPVDGEEYEVPETIANHVKKVLKELK
jgi:hypothetical protein